MPSIRQVKFIWFSSYRSSQPALDNTRYRQEPAYNRFCCLGLGTADRQKICLYFHFIPNHIAAFQISKEQCPTGVAVDDQRTDFCFSGFLAGGGDTVYLFAFLAAGDRFDFMAIGRNSKLIQSAYWQPLRQTDNYRSWTGHRRRPYTRG